MIGDSVEADVLGAMSVEMKAIHFNYDDRAIEEAVTSITQLNHLRRFL